MKQTFSMQKGFSLLEVLISTLILALGLLGVAALQVNAIRYNSSAQLRSLAITQANNMVDRMMANSAGVSNGAYNNAAGIPALPNCTFKCTSTQLAQRDISQWNTANQQLLPSGQGTIRRNGNRLTMIIRWDNDRKGVTGTGCSGNENIDLTCLTMEIEL